MGHITTVTRKESDRDEALPASLVLKRHDSLFELP